MVKVKEIEKERESDADYVTEDEVSDVESEVSDVDVSRESLGERLAALGDIFPHHARRRVAKTIHHSVSSFWGVLRFTGNVGWVICTSSLLLIPLIFFTEAEQSMIEEEKLMMKQHAQGGARRNAGPGSVPLIPSTH